jgi:polyisoprenoid-binding protein YceI
MIFEIDPLHSLFEFSVKHLMISIIRGRFSEVDGTIDINTQNLMLSWIKAQARIDSIYTGVARRDAHLRSADFFDSSNYPYITFESKQVRSSDPNSGFVDGILTLHGISQPVSCRVSYLGQCRDPLTNAWRIGLAAITIIDRRAFGMQFNRIEQGIALIGNEVQIEIHIEAVQSL